MSDNTILKPEQHVDVAIQQMLAPEALELKHLDSVLSDMNSRNADDAEIYLQYKQSESWALDDGIGGHW